MILRDNDQARAQAAAIIRRGGVIGFHTDTLYGLGADPFNHDAVRRVYELKGREEGKPILVVISDYDQIERFSSATSDHFALLAHEFWPGPLTLVVPARTMLPNELTANTGSIGLRLPGDEQVRALVRVCGGALTATSANLSGQPPANSAHQVDGYFGSGVELVIDGGESRLDQPSTVIDVTQSTSRLIREGVVSVASINEELRKHGYAELVSP